MYRDVMKIDLRTEISSRLSEIARLRQEVEALSATARILGIDLAERESQPSDALKIFSDAQRSRGRQPGAISTEWRSVLETLWEASERSSYADIHALAELHGIKAALASVRDRVRNFVESGFLDGDADSGFSVTQAAADRFGFAAKAKTPAQTEASTNPSDGGSDQR